MGVARPGDMGFDVCHLNLHKTFATPHGGGGPGSGPVGCKAFLAPFLPGSALCRNGGEHSIGQVRAFHANFLVVVKALAYLLRLGNTGVAEAAHTAVLNANYLKRKLEKAGYTAAFPGLCMHEFVLTLEELKKETGVSALDVAKSMLDAGIHPPTMYFPLIVHEALMFEPYRDRVPRDAGRGGGGAGGDSAPGEGGAGGPPRRPGEHACGPPRRDRRRPPPGGAVRLPGGLSRV